jgi:hypothetical protein
VIVQQLGNTDLTTTAGKLLLTMLAASRLPQRSSRFLMNSHTCGKCGDVSPLR